MAQNNYGVVQAANDLGSLSTFVKAINQSGLTDRLNNKNVLNVRNHTYIVFAPNDAAFNALPSGTLNSLMQNQNKSDLNTLLNYHIVEDANVNDIGNLRDVNTLKALDGKNLNLSDSNGLMVNGARVLDQRKYDHGIVYVIDRVLLPDDNAFLDKYNLQGLRTGYVTVGTTETAPVSSTVVYNEMTNASARGPMSPAETDMLNMLRSRNDLSTFTKALTAADLGSDFYNRTNHTIFAPNDEAFSVIPMDTLNRLLANRDDVRTLVRYHIIDLSNNSSWETVNGSIRTLQGGTAMINRTDGEFAIDNANILRTIHYNNSIIYVIDRVLFPKDNSFLDKYGLRNISTNYVGATVAATPTTTSQDSISLPPQPKATVANTTSNSSNEAIYKDYKGKGF